MGERLGNKAHAFTQLILLILAAAGLSAGIINPVRAVSWTLNLDASVGNSGTSNQTDTSVDTSAIQTHAFRVGAILTGASRTHLLNVSSWQFTIFYNASEFIPEGYPSAVSGYPDGACGTVLAGINWTDPYSPLPCGGGTVSGYQSSSGQITVVGVNPRGGNIPLSISGTWQFADVEFALLGQASPATQTFTIGSISVDDNGVVLPVAAGPPITETINDIPPTAVISPTHLSPGDPSCSPSPCSAYAFRFDGSASIDLDGTIPNPGGYLWDFGDNTQDPGLTGPVVVHDYSQYVTPGPRSTFLTVFCSPTSVADNQVTTCKATVGESSGGGAVTPCCSVSFTTNSTGTFSLNNINTNTCSLVAGVVGTAYCRLNYTATVSGHHLITGMFVGDSVHTGSDGSYNLPVDRFVYATSTTIDCSPPSVTDNEATDCHVTVTGSETPIGSVSFTANSTGAFSPSNTCKLFFDSPGYASCDVYYTPNVPGHYNVTAIYDGDGAHTASGSSFTGATIHTSAFTVTLRVQDNSGDTGVARDAGGGVIVDFQPSHANVTVLGNASRTDVSCVPSSVQANTNTSCSTTVTDTGATPSTPAGTVTFTNVGSGGFTPSNSCTLVAGQIAGTATCSVNYTPTAVNSGIHTITATYHGDSNHATSDGSTAVSVVSGSVGGIALPVDKIALLARLIIFAAAILAPAGVAVSYVRHAKGRRKRAKSSD